MVSQKKKSGLSSFNKDMLFAHFLVPHHEILSEEEVKSLLKSLKIKNKIFLPHISKDDPVVIAINGKVGDVLRIERKEPEKTTYYRVVVS